MPDEVVLLVEIEVVSEILPIHRAQTRTYLHLARMPVALLLNFGALHLRDGYDRLVHRGYAFLPPSRRPATSGALGHLVGPE